MGLCGGESKKKKSGKTIIIPKGFINPETETVIEIPTNLDATSSLIVKAPTDASNCLTVEAYQKMMDSPHRQRSHVSTFDYPPPGAGVIVAAARPTENSVNQDSQFIPIANSSFKTDSELPQPQPQLQHTCTLPPCQEPTEISFPSPCPMCSRRTQSQVSSLPSTSQRSCVPEQVQNSLCGLCRGKTQGMSPGPMMTSYQHYDHTADNSRPTSSCPATRYLSSMSRCSPNYNYSNRTTVCRDYPMAEYRSSSPCYEWNDRAFESSRNQSEGALLNKLLEDKIDKILKPVLLTLAKTYSMDDEREMSTWDNFSSSPSRKRCDNFFDGGRRGCSNRDLDDDDFFNFGRPSFRSDNYDSSRGRSPNGSRWRNLEDDDVSRQDKTYTICTPSSGCPNRKQNVNFDDWMNSDFSKKNQVRTSFSEKSVELPRKDVSSLELLKRRKS